MTIFKPKENLDPHPQPIQNFQHTLPKTKAQFLSLHFQNNQLPDITSKG